MDRLAEFWPSDLRLGPVLALHRTSSRLALDSRPNRVSCLKCALFDDATPAIQALPASVRRQPSILQRTLRSFYAVLALLAHPYSAISCEEFAGAWGGRNHHRHAFPWVLLVRSTSFKCLLLVFTSLGAACNALPCSICCIVISTHARCLYV